MYDVLLLGLHVVCRVRLLQYCGTCVFLSCSFEFCVVTGRYCSSHLGDAMLMGWVLHFVVTVDVTVLTVTRTACHCQVNPPLYP